MALDEETITAASILASALDMMRPYLGDVESTDTVDVSILVAMMSKSGWTVVPVWVLDEAAGKVAS